MAEKTIIVGIAGNPNSGKTTIFNELTGAHHKVGNYAGVTVEKREGIRKYKDYTIKIYDLPGTYSLTSYSLDELVARDFIIDEKPDIVIDVMDSTNIQRHLYLCMQIQEFGIPIVGLLNMTDEAKQHGIEIDSLALGDLLGIPMLKTVGRKKSGLDGVFDLVIDTYENQSKQKKCLLYGNELEMHIDKIINLISKDEKFIKNYPPRWLAVKLLEKDENVCSKLKTNAAYDQIIHQKDESIKWIAGHFNRDSEIVVTEQRYGYIHGAVKETLKVSLETKFSFSEAVDKVVLNNYLGLPLFLFIMWGIFQLTFKLGEFPMSILELIFNQIGNFAGSIIPHGLIKSLIVDGIIGGVGGMLVFLPNILILFFCISILEDTGYMARIAFLTDKFMHKFGLHGQSFIPFVTGFGCSIPAIMSARTLKNEKDRLITILAVPFFSCGAKLPVYTLLISAFFSESMSGNILFSIYMIGILLGLFSSLLFRKVIAKGISSPFVMELPPYRAPAAKGIGWHMAEKCWFYVKKAGTLIVAASIIVWFITTFPQLKIDDAKYQKIRTDIENKIISENGAVANSDTRQINRIIEVSQVQEALEYSIAGKIGKIIEPVIKPLGFDWKIGVAIITGFAAKEVVVSTLGVMYKVGSDVTEEDDSLREALRNDPYFNPLVAYVLMLFILIYVPCIATLAIIKQELGKWRWVFFTIFYNSAVAWLVAFIVYQTGKIMGLA